MNNRFLFIGAIFGCLAVVLGAFGAHALKEVLTTAQLNSFETAVRYQMYHALLLLFINSHSGFPKKIQKNCSLLISIGVLLFSGSIYAITVGSIPAKFIWFVTPLGGLLLIMSWLLLAFSLFRAKRS